MNSPDLPMSSVVPPLAPATFSVGCRTGRRGGRAKRHDVTIREDWSVETPHDLEAERVAVAFGGYLSCLDLVDKGIPALREWLDLQHRQTLPEIARSGTGWGVRGAIACRCSRTTFRTAEAAVAHASDEGHVRLKFEVPPRQWGDLTAAFASKARMPSGHHDVAHRIRESDGLQKLWQAGISPQRAATYAYLVANVEDALPISFFLGAAYSGVDHSWFAENLRHVPTAEAATWLIWWHGETTEARPGDCGRWLALGVPPRQVEALLQVGLTPEYATDVATTRGAPIGTTARDLARWANVGCALNATHLAALSQVGVGIEPPSPSAIDTLARQLRASRYADLGRTDLAVLIALAGTTGEAALAITSGVRSATDYLTYTGLGG